MKILWCCRFRMEIPMLDEEEFAVVARLLSGGMGATADFRDEHKIPRSGLNRERRFESALDSYEKLTGFRETNAIALYHHRISLYGTPCGDCGRPLRTPQASHCVDC